MAWLDRAPDNRRRQIDLYKFPIVTAIDHTIHKEWAHVLWGPGWMCYG